MRKKLFASAICIAGICQTLPAQAEACSGRSGYVFVTATCTQDRVYSVNNVCQTSRDTSVPTKAIMFVSNVIHDDGGNRRYPGGQFFDEMQIQHDLTMNGEVSFCFNDYDEAVDKMRERIADWKRLFKGKAEIKRVYMDNS